MWRLPLAEPGENEPIRFSLLAPETIVPAFDLGRFGLKWFLEVTVDIAWKPDQRLWVAVTVMPGREQSEDEVEIAPLAVGKDRMEQLWSRAAASTGFDYVEGRLRRRYEDVEVEIVRDDRGRRGSVVVAHIRYPDLRIGLGWDRNRGVLARRPDQIAVLEPTCGPALREANPSDVDDRHVTVERRDAARSLKPLIALGRAVDALASALDGVIASLPPPEGWAGRTDRWETEAKRLRARFYPSALRIRGARDEVAFTVSGRDDGDGGTYAPTKVEASVRPTVQIPSRYHGHWSAGEDPPANGTPAATVCAEASTVDVDAAQIRATVPIGDLDAAFSTLERMLEAADRLAGQQGPYR